VKQDDGPWMKTRGHSALDCLGSGTGKPIATALATCGADVVVTSRDAAHLAAVVKDIEALGRNGVDVSCDVTDPASVQAMVDETVERFGKIDVLVNVAGTNNRFTAEDMPFEEFELLPLRLGWRHEYYDGQAHLTVRPMAVLATVRIDSKSSIIFSSRPIISRKR